MVPKHAVIILSIFFSINMVILRCSQCSFVGVKRQAIEHYLRRHTSPEEVPYFCELCKHKAATEKKWETHLGNFKKHLKMVKSLKTPLSGKAYLKHRDIDFKVTIGQNCQLIPFTNNCSSVDLNNNTQINTPSVPEIGEEITIDEDEQIGEVVFQVYREVDASSLENDVTESDDKEAEKADADKKVRNLEKALKREREAFESYIMKCEKTKKELNKKLENTEDKLIKEKQLRKNIVLKYNKNRKDNAPSASEFKLQRTDVRDMKRKFQDQPDQNRLKSVVVKPKVPREG